MVDNRIEYGLNADVEGLNILHRATPAARSRATTPRPHRFAIATTTARDRRGRSRGSVAARLGRRLLAARPDCRHPRRLDGFSEFSGRVSDSGEGRWTVL